MNIPWKSPNNTKRVLSILFSPIVWIPTNIIAKDINIMHTTAPIEVYWRVFIALNELIGNKNPTVIITVTNLKIINY